MPRYFSKFSQFFQENKRYVLRVGGTGVAIALPSLTEPAYLLLFELFAMDKMGVTGFDNQFAILAATLCPFLYADSLIGNFDSAWELTDDVQEWLAQSTFAKNQQQAMMGGFIFLFLSNLYRCPLFRIRQFSKILLMNRL